MTTYRNANFVKRDYETQNVVACQTEQAPSSNWIEADEKTIDGLSHLYTQAGIRYFGYP